MTPRTIETNPAHETNTKGTTKMHSIFSRHIAKAALGVVLATSILATGTASADRGPSFKAAPEKPIEEYVLGDFRIEDRTIDDFRVVGATHDIGGATGFKVATAPTNGANGGIDDFKAGPGCSIQCITSGVAYARGPNAKLVVKTDTEARIWIHVEGPNGYYRVEDSGATEVMEFGFTFDDLQAGTSHTAWAVAKDKQNYESEAHGAFTTLERNVEIVYTHANLLERAYGSDADFKHEVWLDGEFDDDYTSHNLPAEGNTLGLGIHFIQLDDVERYLDFGIHLYEAPDSCNNLGQIDELFFGPGSCSFLSFAKVLDGENDLDARPASATSWTEWTLNRTMERPSALWLTFDDQLLFEVDVTLNVTYTPRPF